MTTSHATPAASEPGIGATGCDCGLDEHPDAVITLDAQGHVRRWNRAAVAMLGVPAGAAVGQVLANTLTLTSRDRSGRFPERQWAMTAALSAPIPVEVTSWSRAAHGCTRRHLSLRDASTRVEAEGEQEQLALALRRQARFDALTGLANRYELEERLAAALGEIRTGTHVALAVIDLDGFKPINDTHGHQVGDEVLSAVGRRLVAAVRHQDTVARLGGDEFVVLAVLSSDTSAEALAERIRTALHAPVTTSAGLLRVFASLGIALSTTPLSGDELLRQADKAMYRTKLTRTHR